MTEEIRIEVVFATEERQELLELVVPAGSSVEEGIAKSGIAGRFPDQDLASLDVGIWGRVVRRDRQLVDGDRVEIFRPLALDPREARRKLAALGRTMRSSGND